MTTEIRAALGMLEVHLTRPVPEKALDGRGVRGAPVGGGSIASIPRLTSLTGWWLRVNGQVAKDASAYAEGVTKCSAVRSGRGSAFGSPFNTPVNVLMVPVGGLPTGTIAASVHPRRVPRHPLASIL
jgi:hypothetical protein